jgi:hypothetical protein
MTTMRSSVASCVMALSLLGLHGSAVAFELPFWHGYKRFLSEIILPAGQPSRSSASSASMGASEARRKAIRYSSDETPTAPADPVPPPVEDSGDAAMFPRAPGPATENRLRARDRLNGTQGGNQVQLAPITAEPGTPEARRENMNRNLDKAQGYSSGNTSRGGKAGTFISLGTAVGVTGPDGVLVVSCDATNNAAGRIGNDDGPGGTFDVVLNGKLVRARCK